MFMQLVLETMITMFNVHSIFIIDIISFKNANLHNSDTQTTDGIVTMATASQLFTGLKYAISTFWCSLNQWHYV